MDPDWVDDDPSTTVYWSYDYLVGIYRSVYISSLNSDILGGNSMYDYYVENGLGGFLNKAYDLIWAYMLSEEGATDVYDKATALAVLDSFRNLDTYSQMLFIAYFEGLSNGIESIYLAAVSGFLNEEYTEAVATAADNMLYLEISYMTYAIFEDAESLEALKTDLEDTKLAYGALVGDDVTAFEDDFLTAYNSIVQKVEAAIADAEAEAEPELDPAA